MFDLSLLDINNCDGENPMSNGVVLYVRNAKSMSCPSALHLLRMPFMVCTVLSARPLDLGYLGLEVTC